MSNIALSVSYCIPSLPHQQYLHKIAGHSDPTQVFFIQKIVAGACRLGNTFDIR